MKINNFNELNSFHLDIFKEVGNIGGGNAATALANLINKKVTMDVPNVKIMEFKEVSELLESAEKLVVGVLIKILGDLPGYIMFIMEYKTAKILVNSITLPVEKQENSLRKFTNIEISALKEVGNILAGSYLTALSAMTGLKVQTSVPGIAIDMAGAILGVPAIEFGKLCDTVLYIETGFSEGTTKIKGDFILIPALESYEILLKALGVGE